MRRRLLLAIAGVATAAVVLLATPLGLVLSAGYRNQALLRLQRDAIADTRGIDIGGQPGDPVELPRSDAQLTAYDRDGRRVGGSGPPRAPAVARRALGSDRPEQASRNGTLFVAVPLRSGERLTGAVLAVRDDASADHDALGAWLVLAGVALALIVIAVTAAIVLSRRIASPIEALAATARRLGDGDFTVHARRSQIAELDALGTTITATAQRLEQLIGRERAFSADASHQLRTPLQALRLELEAAQLRGLDAPEVAAALAQADRLQATIDTLLAARRDRPPIGEPVAIDDVIGALGAEWHAQLAARGRPLHAGLGARGLRADASATVVREILNVLIANAAAHGSGAITVASRALDGYAAIDVTDGGDGFDSHGGDPFARGSGDGHGIGLSLAQALAHAEGGRVTITAAGPEPTVTLLIPRTR